MSQGPRVGKLSSKECLQQEKGSSAALGRSSVVEVLVQATVVVAIECPNKLLGVLSAPDCPQTAPGHSARPLYSSWIHLARMWSCCANLWKGMSAQIPETSILKSSSSRSGLHLYGSQAVRDYSPQV